MNSMDQLLPLLTPTHCDLYLNAAVLEVTDPTLLAELAHHPKIRRYLLGRLSETVALVDTGQVEQLMQALRAEGYTPQGKQTP